MAKIRAPSQNNGGNSLLTLMCGIALGMVAMWTYMGAYMGDSSSYLSELSTTIQKDDSGWSSIDVYYGEPLETANQQYFAQVHQDEAILDLLGNSGYFVDLAANDAKEFSNTLALEKAGWNGLCIEPNPT